MGAPLPLVLRRFGDGAAMVVRLDRPLECRVRFTSVVPTAGQVKQRRPLRRHGIAEGSGLAPDLQAVKSDRLPLRSGAEGLVAFRVVGAVGRAGCGVAGQQHGGQTFGAGLGVPAASGVVAAHVCSHQQRATGVDVGATLKQLPLTLQPVPDPCSNAGFQTLLVAQPIARGQERHGTQFIARGAYIVER